MRNLEREKAMRRRFMEEEQQKLEKAIEHDETVSSMRKTRQQDVRKQLEMQMRKAVSNFVH